MSIDPFRRLRRILYQLLRWLPTPQARRKLLIVRTDAIGDYVLFRNSIEAVATCDRFRGYRIVLLGNVLWKDLAEKFDSSHVSHFIWIRPNDLYNREAFSFNRIRLLAKVKFGGYDLVIHPVHSRILDVDMFIRDTGIAQRIASSGDDVNYQERDKQRGDRCYTELINVRDASHFEFLRNRDFISGLTGDGEMQLRLEFQNEAESPSAKTVIIAPGAGHTRRQWPPSHFATVMKRIGKMYPDLIFYICGSEADATAADVIINQCPGLKVMNRTGKLSLSGYVKIISASQLLITNESSAVHLAAALEVPAVCISNGNMFGRFSPYPEELNKQVTMIYPSPEFYDPRLFGEFTAKYRVQSDLDISSIAPETVYQECIEILTKGIKQQAAERIQERNS